MLTHCGFAIEWQICEQADAWEVSLLDCHLIVWGILLNAWKDVLRHWLSNSTWPCDKLTSSFYQTSSPAVFHPYIVNLWWNIQAAINSLWNKIYLRYAIVTLLYCQFFFSSDMLFSRHRKSNFSCPFISCLRDWEWEMLFQLKHGLFLLHSVRQWGLSSFWAVQQQLWLPHQDNPRLSSPEEQQHHSSV